MAGLAGVSFSGREDGEQGLKDDVCPDRAGGGSWGSRGTEGGGYRSPGARGSGRAGGGASGGAWEGARVPVQTCIPSRSSYLSNLLIWGSLNKLWISRSR